MARGNLPKGYSTRDRLRARRLYRRLRIELARRLVGRPMPLDDGAVAEAVTIIEQTLTRLSA